MKCSIITANVTRWITIVIHHVCLQTITYKSQFEKLLFNT